MKFLVYVKIIAPETAKNYLQEHIAYLNQHFDKGDFLLFGAFPNSTGGMIIATASERDELEAILAADPLQKGNCATWRVTELSIARVHNNALRFS